ncbi:MAG: ROK family transcriptional regulator [Oscillospiraceae bacterium]|nr:ROK family transcriptional regulator [Oscillospiraceae bacterium]
MPSGKSAAALDSVPLRSRVYRFLYASEDFCSRQSLARECKISMPTLYQNLTDLMDAGLVRYSGESQFTGGRKAQGLEIVPDARIAVGIAVSGHRLRLVATDLRLRELACRSLPFELFALLSGGSGVLAEILEDFLNDYQINRDRLLGVGLTIPGLLTPDHSRILMVPTLGLTKQPVALLTSGIPYPVYVENDGTASGRAEGFARRAYENLAYLSLESGVGGCLLINGAPFYGDQYRSAEFGHICIHPGGRKCGCGRHGCLEAYCSANRILEDTGVSLEDFFLGLQSHVPEYETLWYDMLRNLAVGITTIRMIVDCKVVLGGFLMEYLSPWLPVLKKYVQANDPFDKTADYIEESVLRQNAAPLGAALHFVDDFVRSI